MALAYIQRYLAKGSSLRDGVHEHLLEEWDNVVAATIFETPNAQTVGHSRQKIEGRYRKGLERSLRAF